jgi:hypothetical protein
MFRRLAAAAPLGSVYCFSTKLVDLTSSKSKKTGAASAHGHFIYDRHNVTSVQRCGVYQIGLFESGFGM